MMKMGELVLNTLKVDRKIDKQENKTIKQNNCESLTNQVRNVFSMSLLPKTHYNKIS